MHVDEFERLITRHHENVATIFKHETGLDLKTNPPLGLIETLKTRLTESYSEGVSYNDIMFLRDQPSLRTISLEMNPHHFNMERTFQGLVRYQTVLKACIQILESSKC